MADVTVVLTFDDGPHALSDMDRNYTAQALRTLSANGVQNDTKAVFFIQTHVPHRGGSRVGRQIIRDIWAAGHMVGIHTGSTEDHVRHTERAAQGKLREDLERAVQYLNELGISSVYVRPVGGALNDEVRRIYRALGLRSLLWDIDSKDSHRGVRRPDITAHLRRRIREVAAAGQGEAIVLFHELDSDTRGNIEHYMATMQSSLSGAGHRIRFPTTRSDVLPILQRRASA